MNELNEDIDHLFRDVVEPSEMQPSQIVWASVEKKLDSKQYHKLQKKYGRVFNFSIGISVVVISLVFLILNQNLKKKDGVGDIENAIENNQPLTSANVATNNTKSEGTEKTATPEHLIKTTSSANSTKNIGSSQLATSTATTMSNGSATNAATTNNVTYKTTNTNTNSGITNNTASTTKPSTSAVNVGSATASQNSVAPDVVKVNNTTSTSVHTENNNSTAEVVIEKNNVAAEPSVNAESEKSIEEEKNISENKAHSEHKRSMSSDINLPEPSIVTTDVLGSTAKPITEEKNNSTTATSTENNNLNASLAENASAQNNSITTTEAALGSSPIVNNTELLNSTSSASSENKTEEAKNNTSTIDTASVAKNMNDTAGSNATEQNPLNGLIPVKDFKFFMDGYFSCDKLMTKLFDVSTTSGGSINESQKVDFSAGLRFGYCLTKHWSLLTGVVYSTATSYFDFNKVITSSDEESEDEGERITNYNFATSFGVIDVPVTNSVYHPAAVPEYTSAQLNMEGKQKLAYVSIPLDGRFTMGKNRWSCFIDFGITTNILVSQKTEVTDLNSGVAYSPDINGLKNTYLTAGLGVGVQYRIMQRLSVFIEPTYRQGVTPINKEVPKKTYPSFFGIAGGLAVHF